MTGNWHLDHPTHPIPTKERHCVNLGGGVHPLNKIHMQRCFKGLRFSWNSLHETGHKNARAMGLVVWPPWDSLHGCDGIRCMATMGLVPWTECCFPANLQTGHEIHFMVQVYRAIICSLNHWCKIQFGPPSHTKTNTRPRRMRYTGFQHQSYSIADSSRMLHQHVIHKSGTPYY